jgi:hypothetical protein
MMQLRRQVPSIPIMCALMPRSKLTRSPFRRSEAIVCSRSLQFEQGSAREAAIREIGKVA